MTYDQMEVAEGGQAGLAWDQMSEVSVIRQSDSG
jgi:hypothetical protein